MSPASGPHPLSREQVRRLDVICLDQFGIPGIVLMENAARAVADAARERLRRSGGRRVLIVCGGGNNGGDGYAAARHLHNAGCELTILASPLPELPPAEQGARDTHHSDAQVNARICQRIGIRMEPATPERLSALPADLVIDALFGTGLEKPLRPHAAALIRAANARATPILAVDIPSGLDCDTGRPLDAGQDCIRAAVTVTMAAPKVGFGCARQYTGDVIVADIGAPPEAIAQAMRP